MAKTATALKARYPNMYEIHAGGGCVGWRMECGPHHYILITAEDDARAPDRHSERVCIGAYRTEDDERIQEPAIVKIRDADTFIDELLGIKPRALEQGMRHGKDGKDTPSDGYTVDGMFIVSPYRSDCGRCGVDPWEEYCLTEAEVAALYAAHEKRLQAELKAYTQAQRLRSADVNKLLRGKLTRAQRAWLEDFSQRLADLKAESQGSTDPD